MLARLQWRRPRGDHRPAFGNPHDTEPWEWRCRLYPAETAAPKSKIKFNGVGGLLTYISFTRIGVTGNQPSR
jgi:hypothetical protein